MKTMNSNPKTEFLLGAGLDVLHQESHEWLNTVAFWKDETRFFSDLLNRKDVMKNGESAYGEMLQNLDKIHESLFEYLADDIVAHEKLLARLHKGEKGLADSNYREKHRNLRQRIDIFTRDFREFKKMVFGYVKKL